MFESILYSCKTWGNNRIVFDNLLQVERKALKRCIGVKSGTTDDIIYHELNIPDIKSKILLRQYKFINKVKSFNEGDALVVEGMVADGGWKHDGTTT